MQAVKNSRARGEEQVQTEQNFFSFSNRRSISEMDLGRIVISPTISMRLR